MDLHALVVCPDQDSANLLTLILTELGMAAEHTPSISRGLELLDRQRFDAIILDYHADQSSEEFLTRLRRSAKNRASMLIAVVDSEFNARPVFGLGANFVLYRPLSSERTRISLRAARGLMRRERRRSPRTPVSSTANLAYPGAPELNALLTDLSDGGTSLQTANRIPPSCKVYFEFALPGQQQVVRLSGEVAWQDASGRTGIRFLDVPQSSRRLMQIWLQQKSAHAPTGLPAQPSASHAPTAPSVAPRFCRVASPGPRRRMPPPMPATAVESSATPANSERKFIASAPRSQSLHPLRYQRGWLLRRNAIPLTGQTGVEILVRTADTKLRIRGQVLTAHPGFGMGVRFMFRDSGEREEVLRLLSVLATGPSLDETTAQAGCSFSATAGENTPVKVRVRL